ncbi:plastocyanin/azurin family copper-binding protein [Aliiroseovarius sp.]|uniref:plastocyanin/azurin family copper-binding protein n=1 Tax=Aliiroseovarius sp. TaxID=1872442 RepID=UPI003BAC2A87
MKTVIAALAAVMLAPAAWAEDVVVDMQHDVSHGGGHGEHMVDQITDPGATAATGMFSFQPSVLRLEPGDKMVVLNSTGEHTVHSVPQLWPEDREPVKISNTPRTEVAFETPGVYGFRCARHGLYGMTLLVVVGDGGGVTDISEQIEAMRAGAKEKAAFRRLFQEYLDGR